MIVLLVMTMAVPPPTSLVLRVVREFPTLRTMRVGVVVIPLGLFPRMTIEPTRPDAWQVVILPEHPDDDVAEVVAPIVDAHCRVNQWPEFQAFVSRWEARRMGKAEETSQAFS